MSDTYDAYGVNTKNTFNTEPQIPKTYEDYMASGIVDKMWEAGFIAGKIHEIKREAERRVNENRSLF